MNVWVVEQQLNNGESWVIGVFDSPQAAEKLVRAERIKAKAQGLTTPREGDCGWDLDWCIGQHRVQS